MGNDHKGVYIMNFDNDQRVDTTNPLPVDTIFTGLSLPVYDYISVAYPVATTEVYTFKTGGAGGSTVATVTVVYTDSTKTNLSTVTKV